MWLTVGLRRFVVGLGIGLAGCSAGLASAEPCPELGAALKAAGVDVATSTPVPIDPWSAETGDLRLRADQLLPADYLEDLTAALGKVEVVLSPRPGHVDVNVMAAGRHVMGFFLELDPAHPGAVIIDNLLLENPLAAAGKSNLSINQYAKGLPPHVFRFAKSQLFATVRACGRRTLVTTSQQDFAVVMLYRRVVGMSPREPKAVAYVDYLDRLYKYARRQLPEPLRPRDVQAFTAMLGVYPNVPNSDPARLAIWAGYKKTGKLPEGVRVIEDGGKVVAVVFDANSAAPVVSFVDTVDPDRPLFEWTTMATRHLLSLELDVGAP